MASAVLSESKAPTPTPRLSISLEPPASASPFPSPSSSFLPPPMPGAHEFAVKLPPRRVGVNGNANGKVNGVAKENGIKEREGEEAEVSVSSPTSTISEIPTSSTSTSSTTPTPTPTMAEAEVPAPITPTPGSSAFPPTPTSAFAPSTPPQTHPPLAVSTSLSTSSSISNTSYTTAPSCPSTPTSTRPAPSSPALSRRTSQRSQAVSPASRPVSGVFNTRRQRVSLLALSPTLPSPSPLKRPVKIRDFAFPDEDPRHCGIGPDVPKSNRVSRINRRLGASGDGEDSDEEGENEAEGENEWEWDGFRSGMDRFSWVGGVSGLGSGKGKGYPSEDEINQNFLPDEDEDDEELSPSSEEDGEEQPLLPGLYRALYAFEPEGTAEMRLVDDQIVRVVGRGGGVGWAVVLVEDDTESGVVVEGGQRHALVPESYLELVSLDEEGEGE